MKVLAFLSFLALFASSLALEGRSMVRVLPKDWLASCSKLSCKEALEFAVNKKCNGLNQCRTIVNKLKPDCTKCLDDLFEAHPIDVEPALPLYCSPEHEFQVIVCQIYCRSQFEPTGTCEAIEENPTCQCNKRTTTESTTTTTTTTTTSTSTTTESTTSPTTTTTPAVFQSPVDTLTYDYYYYSPLIVLQNSQVALQASSGEIQVWNVETKKQVSTLNLNSNYGFITAHAVLSNGFFLALGFEDETIRLVSTSESTVVKTLPSQGGRISAIVVLAGNSQYLASAASQGITIWNTVEGVVVSMLKAPQEDGVVNALAALSASGQVASGHQSGVIHIWDTENNAIDKPIRTLRGHESSVVALAVLANGQKIASASRDKTVKIWDLATVDGDNEPMTLRGHTGFLRSMVVLGDRLLATGSDDKTIKIWNPENGALVKTLTGHLLDVTNLAVVSDNLLISGSLDNTVQIWGKI